MNQCKRVAVRMNTDTFQKLRKISYLTERSMNDILEEGLKKVLNDYKNVLTNADIVA